MPTVLILVDGQLKASWPIHDVDATRQIAEEIHNAVSWFELFGSVNVFVRKANVLHRVYHA